MGLIEILKSMLPARIPRDKHLTKKELRFLGRLAQSLKRDSTILEIGCGNGASTYALARAARQNSSEVYSIVSPNSPQVSRLEDTFWRMGFPNVNILPLNFSPTQWNEHFEINLFYVNSPNGITDYIFWEKFLAKDAIVAYHGTNWPRAGDMDTTKQFKNLIRDVNGKQVAEADSIASFTLPGCLDDYYASLERENPFTKKTHEDSSESSTASKVYSA